MKDDLAEGSSSDSRRDVAIRHIDDAADMRKCYPCGCFRGALGTFERSLPDNWRSEVFLAALSRAQSLLPPQRYDCLGCEVCPPALALNMLQEEAGGDFAGSCPTERPMPREGWPPLPGNIRVLRFQAPVAVCTLNNSDLMEKLSQSAEDALSIVGTLQTENLGIERLVINVTANPYLRFLIVCGPETKQSIGHLPGQSLLSLGTRGLDEKNRIVGARGKRPVIQNVERELIEYFRKNITLVDLRGEGDPDIIRTRIRECAARNPGPSDSIPNWQRIEPLRG